LLGNYFEIIKKSDRFVERGINATKIFIYPQIIGGINGNKSQKSVADINKLAPI